MEEYAKAKAQQSDDNAKFIEAIKILGWQASYFCGQYTVRDQNGKFVDKLTASEWLEVFAAGLEQYKQEHK